MICYQDLASHLDHEDHEREILLRCESPGRAVSSYLNPFQDQLRVKNLPIPTVTKNVKNVMPVQTHMPNANTAFRRESIPFMLKFDDFC